MGGAELDRSRAHYYTAIVTDTSQSLLLLLNSRNAIRFCRDIVMEYYSRRKATYRWLL